MCTHVHARAHVHDVHACTCMQVRMQPLDPALTRDGHREACAVCGNVGSRRMGKAMWTKTWKCDGCDDVYHIRCLLVYAYAYVYVCGCDGCDDVYHIRCLLVYAYAYVYVCGCDGCDDVYHIRRLLVYAYAMHICICICIYTSGASREGLTGRGRGKAIGSARVHDASKRRRRRRQSTRLQRRGRRRRGWRLVATDATGIAASEPCISHRRYGHRRMAYAHGSYAWLMHMAGIHLGRLRLGFRRD